MGGRWSTSRQQILKILRKKSDFSLGFFDSRQARPEPQFESLLSQISEFQAFQRRLLKEIRRNRYTNTFPVICRYPTRIPEFGKHILAKHFDAPHDRAMTIAVDFQNDLVKTRCLIFLDTLYNLLGIAD